MMTRRQLVKLMKKEIKIERREKEKVTREEGVKTGKGIWQA